MAELQFLDVQNEGVKVAEIPIEVYDEGIVIEFCGHVTKAEHPKPFLQVGVGGHRLFVFCEQCAAQLQRTLYDLVVSEAAMKVIESEAGEDGCAGGCGGCKCGVNE